MIIVQLNREERREALRIAKARDVMSREVGNKDAHGFAGGQYRGMLISMWGALAEKAAAKGLGFDCDLTVGTYKAVPDLPNRIEVRYSSKDHGLVVRNNDWSGRKYLLVKRTGLTEFVLAGWVYGREAMRNVYLDAPDPNRPACYHVPIKDLKDPRELVHEPEANARQVDPSGAGSSGVPAVHERAASDLCRAGRPVLGEAQATACENQCGSGCARLRGGQ